ncbi:hypothetical protein SAMN04488038_12010 [Solimonas aquatica]|uniref:Uncharacterized protein n=1 Tax=Solimonas aquatica TaxID=489703 RepID=A0A1H9MAM7_9GAMM|nr:hypothetical protein [Solimonas aquatica]SER20193.1 hypothetical protein SAMN04488038_12010 [Solimonas aquatica]
MSDEQLLLPGLDASNPLGFFAALGLLQSLSDSGRPGAGTRDWRLSWRDVGYWAAVLHGSSDFEDILARLEQQRCSWESELALQLAYNKENGARVPTDAEAATFDLKPAPAAFADYLAEVVDFCRPASLRSVRTVAAYGSELVAANKGDLKPTALHFTAGQQTFLGMVRTLQQGVRLEDFREALQGPWKNLSTLPSLSWNASAPRIYALRASNPSGEKRGSVPGADWLAYLGLRFFPVASRGAELKTACVAGGWKDSNLRWPVWSPALTVNAIRSLLSTRALRSAVALSALMPAGVMAIYESSILRSDQGGYGSFSPARVL